MSGDKYLQVECFEHVPGVNDAEYIRMLQDALARQKVLTDKAVAKLRMIPEKIVRCRVCRFRDDEGFCSGRGWPMQIVPDEGFCDKGDLPEGSGI